jgi:hypothetical protein
MTNYEQLYMDTLYHYLAEIHFINKTDILKKEEQKDNLIKEYTDKIIHNLSSNKDNKEKIKKINDLIEVDENEDDNDINFLKFKENLKDFFT